MVSLIIRPAPDGSPKPWSVDLRYPDLSRAEYRTIGYATDTEARDLIDAGGAYYLFGDPRRTDDVAAPPSGPFQRAVLRWMDACFGADVAADRLERSDRLAEEVLELLQSVDYPRERLVALEGYVFGRPKGEAAQEVGGVMLTLAAWCGAHGIDMQRSGDTELARVWTIIDAIRRKQAAKPHGSALPVGVGPSGETP